MITFEYNEQIALSIFLGIVFFIIFSEKREIFNNEKVKKIAPFIIFFLITIYNIWDNNKLHIDILQFDNKKFVFWLLLCIVITIYVLGNQNIISDPDDNEKIKEAVRKAFIALIISFFTRLDLVVAPFFLVLIFSYFSDFDWV